MNVLVGLDLVECGRFVGWIHFSDLRLQRIFSADEVAYCKQERALAAQRFAVRYAAREALYKSLSSINYGKNAPFLLICRATKVVVGVQGVSLNVDWESLASYYEISKIQSVSVSLSHTKTVVGALVSLVIV